MPTSPFQQTPGLYTTNVADRFKECKSLPQTARIRQTSGPGDLWKKAITDCMGDSAAFLPSSGNFAPRDSAGICEAYGECCVSASRCGIEYTECAETTQEALGQLRGLLGSGGLCGSLRRQDRRGVRTVQRIERRTDRSDFRQDERQQTRDARLEQREARGEFREERRESGGGLGGVLSSVGGLVGGIFGAKGAEAAQKAAPFLLIGAVGLGAAYLMTKK